MGNEYSAAMDIPQSKYNKTRYFADRTRNQSRKSTQGSIRFDSRLRSEILVRQRVAQPRKLELRTISDNCEFATLTSENFLRLRSMFQKY